jgi:hypothetical protein
MCIYSKLSLPSEPMERYHSQLTKYASLDSRPAICLRAPLVRCDNICCPTMMLSCTAAIAPTSQKLFHLRLMQRRRNLLTMPLPPEVITRCCFSRFQAG